MLFGFSPHGLRGGFFFSPVLLPLARCARGGLFASINGGVMPERLVFRSRGLDLTRFAPLLARYGRGSREIRCSFDAAWPLLGLNASCAASAVFAARGVSVSRETRSDAPLRALVLETEKVSRETTYEAAFKVFCFKNWRAFHVKQCSGVTLRGFARGLANVSRETGRMSKREGGLRGEAGVARGKKRAKNTLRFT